MELTPGTRRVFDFQEIRSDEGVKQLGELLNRCFPVAPGRHFFDDFPVWRIGRPSDIARLGIYEDGQRLVSSAGLRLARLRTPAGLLKIALIGAVATDASCRGLGLASALVKHAVRAAEAQGAALVILWGSEYEMYQKLGFELCGLQARFRLEATSATAPAADSSKELANVQVGWHPRIVNLMTRRTEGLAIGPEDLTWMGAHKGVEWFWEAGPSSDPIAFAALGRGIDLVGFVHEWGGDSRALGRILQRIARDRPGSQLLGNPNNLAQLKLTLPLSGEVGEPEFLCMAKILDPAAILAAHSPRIEAQFARDPATESWTVTPAPGRPPVQVTSGDLVQMFFGPAPEHSPLPASEFPLPLWLWGLDAV